MPLTATGVAAMEFLLTSRYNYTFASFLCDELDPLMFLAYDLDDLGIIPLEKVNYVLSYWTMHYELRHRFFPWRERAGPPRSSVPPTGKY